MLRNYFAWAGGKTPTVKTDVPDAPTPAAPAPKEKAPAKADEPKKKK